MLKLEHVLRGDNLRPVRRENAQVALAALEFVVTIEEGSAIKSAGKESDEAEDQKG